MRLLVFGLSITSSWGNGHATTYRGLLKALGRLGVETTFVEKDVPWYASNRDMPSVDFARVELYDGVPRLRELLDTELGRADGVILGSYFPDGVLVAGYLAERGGPLRLYYDIDTPVTLAAFAQLGAAPYLRADQIPIFDAVLSFTGGRALREMEERWGARRAVAFFCALDPEVHHPTPPEERFRSHLSYMGTYSADRHHRWEQLFLRPALRLPERSFLLAGPQYPAMELPGNVRHFEHLAPVEHPAFYSSSAVTLNITRRPMVEYGCSPSVRLFEAAGCGTCVVSDPWEGLGEVFEVGREVLVASEEGEMVRLLAELGAAEAAEIGERARARALREHTYEVRAAQLMELLEGL